ncbi:MAG: hypothetical protein QXF14_04445, partial [Candidatus Woesearchaeota archaeon]
APIVVGPQNSFDMAGYRYDTAVLEWEWEDKVTRQVRTDKAECSIREVGGAAPAFCALDAFSGKFRCMFGEQESGIRIISAKETYPEKQKAFALGDKLNFSLEIKQVFPEERRFQNQARKFLTYEIRDSAGNVVDALMPDGTTKLLQTTNDATSINYALTTNGNYRLMVPMEIDDTPLGTFVLNEDTIKRHSALGPTTGGVLQELWPIISLKKFVTTLTVKEGNTPATTKYGFVINFIDYGKSPGDAKYEVRQVNPAALDKLKRDDRTGWLDSTTQVIATGQQSPDTPSNRITFTIPGTATKQEVNVMLEFDKAVFSGTDKLQILAIYDPTKVAGQKGCDPNTPITWKAYFTLYDADRQGNPSEQISTDPETGEPQQKTITFQVQCAPKSALQTTEATAPKEFEAAAQTLIEILKNLKNEEENATNEINKLNKTNATEIIQFLKKLAQNERNAQIALVKVTTSIKEEGLKEQVRALQIMNALTTAANQFEESAKKLESTLPGNIPREIETALKNAEKTLETLKDKKQAALTALGAKEDQATEPNTTIRIPHLTENLTLAE